MGNDDTAIRQRALADLCTLYWPPVYAFVRSKGFSVHDAEDLTQGFFAQFLEREDFEKSNASRGKLRSYLLGAVNHYLSKESRKERRQKRGGAAQVLSIEADEAESRVLVPELAESVTPESIYDRQWATTLLENVIGELEDGYEKKGKAELFKALRPFISTAGVPSTSQEIAERFEMSEAAVRVTIHRLRQRYGVLLRQAVSDTLGPDEDVDAELRELMAAFS